MRLSHILFSKNIDLINPFTLSMLHLLSSFPSK
jgi:hypothetical protein